MAGDDVEDRLAILQVEAEYARTWDTRDAAGWAALFTEDGAFELGGLGDDPSYRFSGRDRLTRFCEKVSGRQEGIHLLGAPSLSFDGDDTARGWVHFQYFDRNRETDRRRHVVGVYAVTYVRCADGRWRMRLRREQPVAIDDRFEVFPSPARMWEPDALGLD